jgi:hypothetical protein
MKNIKFKSLNLNFPRQIVLLWTFICIISLFLPWIQDVEKGITWNSFYSLSWNIGFLLSIILFLPMLTIFSTSYKEKLKLYSDLSVKNHFIIMTSWFFVISFSIISLSFINWLHTFFENIVYWNWIVLSLTSWMIILLWWTLIRKEYYKNNSEIILNTFDLNREENKEKDNMKLPF